ncbi:uncharacterized protein LOC111467928 isoform X2 [Cucurbita maxima]|uniref:Uncharacterized protein LOC111467928 isoform X2 n=1 Tax=Cucurbita maxima TaxID=3661 RepID=A0A6J1HZ53_CUCMA|nr:uncharacterized protein LOC111467928 isoform X2 [Cucurbita maxima]
MKLYIGKWQLPLSNTNKLVVKGLFVKKQLCYEISSNGCRVKIEIDWSNIIGIRAAMKKNEPGVLEVELSEPPKFYKELGQKDVGAHSQWVDGSDFTRGQASTCSSTHQIQMIQPADADPSSTHQIQMLQPVDADPNSTHQI